MASVWLCIVRQMACSGAGLFACAALTSMFRIWLQRVQPGEARYQQRRILPYIFVAHPGREAVVHVAAPATTRRRV